VLLFAHRHVWTCWIIHEHGKHGRKQYPLLRIIFDLTNWLLSMMLYSDEVTGRPTNALRDCWRYSTLYHTACYSSDKFLRFPLYELLDSCQCRTSVMNSSARHPLSNLSNTPIPNSYHQLYHQTRQPRSQLWPARLPRAFSPPLAPRPASSSNTTAKGNDDDHIHHHQLTPSSTSSSPSPQ
jgi:hypothetical protein